MLNNNFDAYSFLWENPEDYLLAPVPDWVKDHDLYGSHNYIPYKKLILGYAIVGIPQKFAEKIITNMIKANVEIVIKIHIESEFEKCQHMWTDRKQEFGLCKTAIPDKYTIFHIPSCSIIKVTGSLYDLSIGNMLKAKVRVFDTIPYKTR